MPLYAQVIDYILEKIHSGEWQPGFMIPTEAQLCEQFAISRPTVRVALSHLVSEGYLVRQKAKGSFVAQPKMLEESTVFISSFNQEMMERGLEIQTEVLEQRMVSASPDVAIHLKIPEGAEVFKLVRLRYVKDSFSSGPIVHTTIYFPPQFRFLLNDDFENQSVSNVLARHDIHRRYVEKNIDSVQLDSRISRLMGLPENSLGLCIHSVSHPEDREAVLEYTQSYYPSGRNTFRLRLRL